MIVTRSASRSTSLRMWLDSSTVVPAASRLGDAVGEDLLHQRVQPRGRLVEDRAGPSGAANAATRATFCRLPLE